MKGKNNSVSYFDMQFITSSISTTLVLLLLGLVVFFVLAAHNLSVYVKENISFSVLVSDDMKESDILKLQKRLDKEAFVKQTEYISKKQALREQTEAMGTDPQEFLGYNPFTASIEIKLHSDYANSDSIAKIEKLIKKNTNIQEVLYQKDLIDAVNDNIRNISLMLLGLGCDTDVYLLCADKQHHPSGYIFQAFPYPHHEAGGSKLGIHPSSVSAAQFLDRCAGRFHSRQHSVGSRLLAGVLRTGVGQGDYARGDGAGVGCRAGVRCTYYVAVRFAFHQQISEDEGKHTVLYLTP